MGEKLIEVKIVTPQSLRSEGTIGLLDIEPIDRRQSGEPVAGVTESPIRLGEEEPVSIQLPAGKYLASVRLPSGRILKEVLDVALESDASKQVLKKLSFGSSLPQKIISVVSDYSKAIGKLIHNSKAYELIGEIGAHSDAASLRKKSARAPKRVQEPKKKQELLYLRVPFDRARARRVIRKAKLEAVEGRTLLPHGWSRLDLLKVLGLPSVVSAMEPTASSFERLSVRAQPADGEKEQHKIVIDYAILNGDTAGGQQMFLARLPGRWPRVRQRGVASVKVEVKQSSRTRRPCLDIQVSDQDAQDVLNFIRQSNLRGALAVIDGSRELLSIETKNPYAAAAAGYVMLLAPSGHNAFSWPDWITSLGRTFRHLPDGKIQHATLLLQSPPETLCQLMPKEFPTSSDARARLAASMLLDALSEGMPLYRAGLRLLASNLRILLDERPALTNRDLLSRASELVNWLLMRADPNQIFSVLDISDLYRKQVTRRVTRKV